jgi:hypothetical protein
MSEEAKQSEEAGTFRRVITDEGVKFEEIHKPPATGVAYVEPEKAKTRRDLELEAGKRRVAENAELIKNRPPRIISEAEKRAQGSSVPVFRPNQAWADRAIVNNQRSTVMPELLRRVGGNAAAKPPE